MPWIEQIMEEDATGRLQEIYQEITRKRGKLSNIMRVHSLHPEAMKEHMDLYISIMFSNSDLTREERELIAVIVSACNHCSYCIQHHAEALLHYWRDDERIRRVIADFRNAGLPDKILSMLEYVEKLTQTPDKIKSHDVERLKRVGLSDRSILDINLITSYFNFVNRIVLGLGVEFAEDEVKGYKV
jgi:uncharacterized peroxidase-related enzyme